MTTELQEETNKKNALQSTGPKDCTKTRFNAVRHGLTGDCIYSKEEEKVVCNLYDELSESLNPQDSIERILVGQLAKSIWKLQRISQLQEAFAKNSLIRKRNSSKGIFGMPDMNEQPEDAENEIIVEWLNTDFELLLRYETSTENRFLKLVKFLYAKKEGFKGSG